MTRKTMITAAAGWLFTLWACAPRPHVLPPPPTAASIPSGTPAPSAADRRLEALMAQFWEAHVEDVPLEANVFGDLSHMDKLDRMSPAAFAARRARFDRAIAELASIERRQLRPLNRTNRDMFEWVLKGERMLLDSPTRFFTFSTLGGWYATLPQLVALTPFRTAKDYDDYIARLSEVGRFADELIELSRQGIRAGYVHPCDSLQGIADGVDSMVPSSAEESFAFGPVDRIPETVRDAKGGIRARLKTVIDETVTPAYQRYASFLRDEYLPACRKTFGIGALEGGQEAYADLVRYYSTLQDMTPDRVHEMGHSEVKRIREEMEAIVKEVEFDSSLSAFFEFMRTNADFFTKDRDAYLARIAVISKEIDRKLPQYFAYVPRNRFALTPIPDSIAPRSTIAYYQPGSAEKGVPGQYFVNLYDLGSKSLAELPALSLHEAEPGHHFQISVQQELADLPRFRRSYYISAFGEGWGLYAEYLGIEMGIYATPYERFGKLSFEMWRACRLVVDTGLHAKGWTRQKAIDYMANNSSLSLANITNEVDRYITYPGQAISYKLGELKIKELRKSAEATLGERFSLRDFHAHLLKGGAIPLQALERRMNEWVEAQRAR